jgi:putative membrane protein
MKRLPTTIGAIVVIFTAGQALAALSPADKTFATKAASDGAAEVMLGKLAMHNAGSAQVRQLGDRMVTDHTQANDELQQIGRREDLTLPTRPGTNGQAMDERLGNMKGQTFDATYTRDMVQDHEQAIADFRKEAATGQDAELKAFAQKYLPVLERHLQLAKAAEAE